MAHLIHQFLRTFACTDKRLSFREGSELIPLELKFEVNQEGRLEGTSVTNFFSQDRTKSRIVGQVDFERERLSFREVENLFTRSDADEQEFCYVQVPDMSWKEEGSKAVYEGRFVGYFPDSSTWRGDDHPGQSRDARAGL